MFRSSALQGVTAKGILAMMVLASFGPVLGNAIPQAVAATPVANGNSDLEGRKTDGSWVDGNVCAGAGSCYAEGQNVPHRVKMDNLVLGTEYFFQTEIEYLCNGAIIGYSEINSPSITSGSVDMTGPSANGNYRRYTFSFTATDDNPTITFNARVGQDAAQCGSGNLDVRMATGNETVTLPINEIVAVDPAPTPSPTAPATPSPTATPSASPTATPTAVPSPSSTPLPSASPTSTPTVAPTPTATPTSTPLPSPSASPEASPTPTIVNISVTKTDGKSTIVQGAANSYDIIVTNNGTVVANPAYILDTIPAQYDASTVALSCAACSFIAGNGTANVYAEAILDPGESATLTVSATLKPDASGTILNTVTAGSAQDAEDVDKNDNAYDDATFIVVPEPTPQPSSTPTPSSSPSASPEATPTATPEGSPAPSATPEPTPTPSETPEVVDISVTKTDGKATISAGASNTYTITVKNEGTILANPAYIIDSIPAQYDASSVTLACPDCSLVTGNGTNSVYAEAFLDPGESATLTVSATLKPDASGTILNTAIAGSSLDGQEANGNNNAYDDATFILVETEPTPTPTASATPSPTPIIISEGMDIGAVKTDNKDTIPAGASNTYFITVTNHGTVAANPAYVIDTIPAQYDASTVSIECDACSFILGAGTAQVYAEVPLDPGESAVVSITATIRPDATGTIANNGISGMANDENDVDKDNNAYTDYTLIATNNGGGTGSGSTGSGSTGSGSSGGGTGGGTTGNSGGGGGGGGGGIGGPSFPTPTPSAPSSGSTIPAAGIGGPDFPTPSPAAGIGGPDFPKLVDTGYDHTMEMLVAFALLVSVAAVRLSRGRAEQ